MARSAVVDCLVIDVDGRVGVGAGVGALALAFVFNLITFIFNFIVVLRASPMGRTKKTKPNTIDHQRSGTFVGVPARWWSTVFGFVFFVRPFGVPEFLPVS